MTRQLRLSGDSTPRNGAPDDTGRRVPGVEDYRVFVKRFATAGFPWRNAKCIPLLCNRLAANSRHRWWKHEVHRVTRWNWLIYTFRDFIKKSDVYREHILRVISRLWWNCIILKKINEKNCCSRDATIRSLQRTKKKDNFFHDRESLKNQRKRKKFSKKKKKKYRIDSSSAKSLQFKWPRPFILTIYLLCEPSASVRWR